MKEIPNSENKSGFSIKPSNGTGNSAPFFSDAKKLSAVLCAVAAFILFLTVPSVSSSRSSSDQTGEIPVWKEVETYAAFADGVSLTVTAENAGDIIASRTESELPLLTGLLVGGVSCAYDRTENVFYYSAAPDFFGSSTKIRVEAMSESGEICIAFFEDECSNGIFTLGSESASFSFAAYDSESYELYKLYFTPLPVIDISLIGNDEIGDEYKSCVFRAFDPLYNEHGGAYHTASEAYIRLRGASSRTYEKKSWRVELTESIGVVYADGTLSTVENDVPLLGMRSDGDWILNAIYYDPTLIHEKLSYDLWEMMSEGRSYAGAGVSTGPRCEYAEVVLNGRWTGIYLLLEPADEKQLGVLKEESSASALPCGKIVKAFDWMYTSFAGLEGAPIPTETIWGGFELKSYGYKFEESDWDSFYRLVKSASDGTDGEFMAYAVPMLNGENIIDYYLFLTVTCASDNTGKNILWYCRSDIGDDSVYLICPWDLDNSWGYWWYYSAPTRVPAKDFDPAWCEILGRYLYLDANGASQALYERWQELKNGICSPESLSALIKSNYSLLTRADAFEREALRWPYEREIGCLGDPVEESEYISEWLDGMYEAAEYRITHIVDYVNQK